MNQVFNFFKKYKTYCILTFIIFFVGSWYFDLHLKRRDVKVSFTLKLNVKDFVVARDTIQNIIYLCKLERLPSCGDIPEFTEYSIEDRISRFEGLATDFTTKNTGPVEVSFVVANRNKILESKYLQIINNQIRSEFGSELESIAGLHSNYFDTLKRVLKIRPNAKIDLKDIERLRSILSEQYLIVLDIVKKKQIYSIENYSEKALFREMSVIFRFIVSFISSLLIVAYMLMLKRSLLDVFFVKK